jgi:hypothetical protein
MLVSLHLHGPTPHVEKLTDVLVLFPIFLLTRLGAVLDGLALAAIFDHGMSLAGEAAALGHDNDGGHYVDVKAACKLRATLKCSRSRSRGRIENVLSIYQFCVL